MSMATLNHVKHNLNLLSGLRPKSESVPTVPVQHLLSRHADTVTILGKGFIQEHTKTVEAYEYGYWRIVNTTGATLAEGRIDVSQPE